MGMGLLLLVLAGVPGAYAAMPENAGMIQIYQEKADFERQRIETYRTRIEDLNAFFSKQNAGQNRDILKKLSDYYDTLISDAAKNVERYEALARESLRQFEIARLIQTSA